MLREELRKTKAMEKDLLNEVDEILYDMDSNNNNNGPQKVNPVFSLQKALSKLKMIFFSFGTVGPWIVRKSIQIFSKITLCKH